MRTFRLTSLSALLCATVLACSSDPAPAPDTTGAETSPEDTAPDTGEDIAEDTAPDPSLTGRVVLDLDATFDAPGEGFVRARQVTDAADLPAGEVAQGLVGDWLLENAHGRYLIGYGQRAIGPCSWDGNPIEVEAVRDGTRKGSSLGEICFLLNVAQTVAPEHVEVLEDGSAGRAVIAVTGRVVPFDFLNLTAMLNGFAPGLLDLVDFEPERPLPLRVTFYYVLTPSSRSLRVVTAMRNDGLDEEFFVPAQIVLSGSTGAYFTPLGEPRGWGYRSLGADSLSADPVSFVGYVAKESGYVVVPDPDPAMEADLPVGGGMLAISGTVALIYGTTDVLGVILAPRDDWPFTPGIKQAAPGAVTTVGYRLYPTDGSVATASDAIFEDLGVETTRLSGRVVDASGAARGGVRVHAVKDGERSYTMAVTGEDGRFAMQVPRGDYELWMRDDGVPTRARGIAAEAPTLELGDLSLVAPGRLTVKVRRPDGTATPARVVIACDGTCPEGAVVDSRERDGSETPPNGWVRLVELGVAGEATLPLLPGAYRVSVNRGMTWSTWPQDATASGGARVEVTEDAETVVEAEIAEVVDTSGTLSADFHIHAMNSPDSQVADRARVLDMMAGGLDVMVSTDHDAIADFRPTIDALGAGDEITSIVGSEITTAGYGHVNAFPLERDPTARKGGPIDWSNEGTYHTTLQELIDAVRAYPGEQVVQLNHPSLPMGAIGLLMVDVIAGISLADPTSLRMAPTTPDPETGDTRLWTEEFDAVELYNGFGEGSFWSYFRWWLAMVGRGFAPTGTAVTDTHGLYGSLGASPRSFVFVDENADTPATMDLAHFVERVNGGALIGTNGPFMRVDVLNSDGVRAGLGETLRVTDGAATLRVVLEMPEWIDVDTLDVYMNVPAEGLVGAPGVAVEDPLEPTERIEVAWNPEVHREVAATGTETHYRLRQTVEVPLEVTADSYVVVRAHGQSARSMRGVVGSAGVRPMAFSNPVFIDADGGGYDNPPLRAAQDKRLDAVRSKTTRDEARRLAEEARIIIPRGEKPTRENLGRLLEAMSCKHNTPDAVPHHHDHGNRGHSHPHPH